MARIAITGPTPRDAPHHSCSRIASAAVRNNLCIVLHEAGHYEEGGGKPPAGEHGKGRIEVVGEPVVERELRLQVVPSSDLPQPWRPVVQSPDFPLGGQLVVCVGLEPLAVRRCQHESERYEDDPWDHEASAIRR